MKPTKPVPEWLKKVRGKRRLPARLRFYRTKPVKKWVNRGTSSN